jgi:2-oxoglutarate ferredoxin oxidoreductase subunit alpha
MKKELLKGNEAIAEAALRGGCRAFFGYPITPQNEIPEYMSRKIFDLGGMFVQAESEVSAINMVYGAAGTGVRTMTSTSSPGLALKQEGISYIAGAELPCLIVNIVRAGPGLGGILPAQSDYFAVTKGGGHGDYRMLVYAPASVQEAADLAYTAFDKAEKYRIPVLIQGDGILGQMMEAVKLPDPIDPAKLPRKAWATEGDGIADGRKIINSLYINPQELDAHNRKLVAKAEEMAKCETLVENYMTDDAEVVIVAYGTVGRIAKSTVDILREKGVKAGLIRPITLFPFPSDNIAKVAAQGSVKSFLAAELSMGQMVEDVRLAVNGKKPVEFYGKCGGVVMTAEEIAEVVTGGKNA